jgi:hypothetical protein
VSCVSAPDHPFLNNRNQTKAVADFAPFYPGLQLGCMKVRAGCTCLPRGTLASRTFDAEDCTPRALPCPQDPKDNVFCGLKRGDAQAGDCTFYYSCCYAELEKTTPSTDTDKAQVEDSCPGARAYLAKGVCAM